MSPTPSTARAASEMMADSLSATQNFVSNPQKWLPQMRWVTGPLATKGGGGGVYVGAHTHGRPVCSTANPRCSVTTAGHAVQEKVAAKVEEEQESPEVVDASESDADDDADDNADDDDEADADADDDASYDDNDSLIVLRPLGC